MSWNADSSIEDITAALRAENVSYEELAIRIKGYEERLKAQDQRLEDQEALLAGYRAMERHLSEHDLKPKKGHKVMTLRDLFPPSRKKQRARMGPKNPMFQEFFLEWVAFQVDQLLKVNTRLTQIQALEQVLYKENKISRTASDRTRNEQKILVNAHRQLSRARKSYQEALKNNESQSVK